MPIIEQEETSEEFKAAWIAAGNHLQSQCSDGINWIRDSLKGPFIEHLSFRIVNQLFFVFIEAAEFQLSNGYEVFMKFAGVANAIPCVIKMNKNIATYEPSETGWGLLHATTKERIDPLALVSEELIVMSDWELHDFAISVVKNSLEKDGKNVYSTCSDININPSLWFEEDNIHYWVVIRGLRHPLASVERPHNIEQIAKNVMGDRSNGYFALVMIANSDNPFDPNAGENGNFLSLYRGHSMKIKYAGIQLIDAQVA